MKLFYTEEEVIDGMQKSIESLDAEKDKIDDLLSSLDQLKLPLVGINFQEEYTLLKNDFDVSDFTYRITQKYNEIKRKNETSLGKLESIMTGDASDSIKESVSQKVSSVKEHQSNLESIFENIISFLGKDSLRVEEKREKAEEAALSFGMNTFDFSESNNGLGIILEYIKQIIEDSENYINQGYVSIPSRSLTSGSSYFSFTEELGIQLYGVAALYSFSKDNYSYLRDIYKSLEESQYLINKASFALKKNRLDVMRGAKERSMDRKKSLRWPGGESMSPYYENDDSTAEATKKIDEEVGKAQNAAFFEVKSSAGKIIKDIFEKTESCVSRLSLESVDGDGMIYQVRVKDYIDLFKEDFRLYSDHGSTFFAKETLDSLSKHCKLLVKYLNREASLSSVSYTPYIPSPSIYISEIPNAFYSSFCFSSSEVLNYLNLSHSDVSSRSRLATIQGKVLGFFKEDRLHGEMETLMLSKDGKQNTAIKSVESIPEALDSLFYEIKNHMSEENLDISEVDLKNIEYLKKIESLALDVNNYIDLLYIIKNRILRFRGSLFKSNGTTGNFEILKNIKIPRIPDTATETINNLIKSVDGDFSTIRVYSGESYESHNIGLERAYIDRSECFIKIYKDGKKEYVGFENLIRETIDLFLEKTKKEIENVDSKKEILDNIISNIENPENFFEDIKNINERYNRFEDTEYEKDPVFKDFIEKISSCLEERSHDSLSSFGLGNSLFFSNFNSNDKISRDMIYQLTSSRKFGLDPVDKLNINNISLSKFKQSFDAYSVKSKEKTKVVAPKYESIVISHILTDLKYRSSTEVNIYKNESKELIKSFKLSSLYFDGSFGFGRGVDSVKNSYSIFYDIFERHSYDYSFSDETKRFLKTAKKKQNSPRFTKLFLMLFKTDKPLGLMSFVEIIRSISKVNVETAISFAERILDESSFVEAILTESIHILSLNKKSTNLIDIEDCLGKVDVELGAFEKSFVISNVLKNIHNNPGQSNICDILYSILSLDFLEDVHNSEAKSSMLDFASELVCMSSSSTKVFTKENFNKNLEKLKEVGFEFKEDIEGDLDLVSEALVFSQNIFGSQEDGSVSSKENFAKIKSAMNNIKFLKSISNLKESHLDIFSKNKDIDKNEELFELNFEVTPQRLRFRVLEKYDSYAMKVGADTNCCQVLGGAGEPCVIDSVINPTSSVLILEAKFEEEESLKSLSGKSLPEATVDGYRIIAQSYFHFVEKETEVEVGGQKFMYNKYFVLDNIETSFSSMQSFYEIFNISFDGAYKSLSDHVIKIGYDPILVGKGFSPEIIKKNTSGRSNSDDRIFAHDKKYTDFKKEDFVVLNKNLDDKMARYMGINAIYKII